MVRRTPADFQRLFPGSGGALYGRGDARLDEPVQAQRGGHAPAGALPGGGQRAPGAGGTDGGDVGPARGRDALGAPRFDAAVEPGAYLWWYVDALSDDGRHALTLIAFVGSVFSPYYRRAVAQGRGVPEDHCALNVALYSPGANRWTMTERGAGHVERGRDHFRIGPSALHWQGGVLKIEIDEIASPLPRRVRGTVTVRPQGLCRYVAALDAAGRHRWGPIAPCADIEVAFDSPGLRWSGHAYVDSNEGDEPVDRRLRRVGLAARPHDATAGRSSSTTCARCAGGAERLIATRFGADGSAEPFDPPPRQALPPTGWARSPSCTQRDRERGRAHAGRHAVLCALDAAQPALRREVQAMHETLDVRRLDRGWVQLLPVSDAAAGLRRLARSIASKSASLRGASLLVNRRTRSGRVSPRRATYFLLD